MHGEPGGWRTPGFAAETSHAARRPGGGPSDEIQLKATPMARFKVTFRDRSIEIYEADRVVDAHGEVRLLASDDREVASWDEAEVHAIQEVDEER